MASQLLARLIRLAGGKALDSAVSKVLPPGKGGGVAKVLGGAALTRLATRSVPGAILVGGGLLAKLLYDRRHARKASPIKDETDDIG